MCPEALLLLLLLAALNSESSATLSHDNNTGLDFTVVFLENIAYYFPSPPINQVQVTALFNDTSVSIKQSTYDTRTVTLDSEESRNLILDARIELDNFNNLTSEKAVHITSNKHIVIQAVSLKNNSVQTAVVIPTDKLGKKYFIPPAPIKQDGSDPIAKVSRTVTERDPFRLVIINADKPNTVTVEGRATKQVSLKPYHITQIWLDDTEDLQVVTATDPVAVLFGHPCVIWHNCYCTQLLTMLLPAKDESLTFFISPFLTNGSEESTVLQSMSGSTKVEAYNPDSPLVKTAGTAVLYSPGLLLTLIPESDFAACYIVTSIPEMNNFAVVILHKDFTDGVRVGRDPPKSVVWQELKGTDYVSARIRLLQNMTVIWHTSSKMAVYFMGGKESTLFGNPAPIVSKSPDFRGCVLFPETLEIGAANGWRESLQTCKERDLELISLSKTEHHKQVGQKLFQSENLEVVWTGMRRSSLTGEWYWLNGDQVSNIKWGKGEPGTVADGQCAIMGLDESVDFGLSDEDCCKAVQPVCYRDPIILASTQS